MGYYPGADEHQTGLAVNFVGENAEAKFSTPVLEWMREHCAEYGFILRYPEGREEYTGRDPEPGHFRYVGEVAAEYTFFLAVPVMFGASLLKIVRFGTISGTELGVLLVGMAVAFGVSILAIRFLMGYIRKHDFTAFGWYRIGLGLLVLLYFYVIR